jgi:hypothetical protein
MWQVWQVGQVYKLLFVFEKQKRVLQPAHVATVATTQVLLPGALAPVWWFLRGKVASVIHFATMDISQ